MLLFSACDDRTPASSPAGEREQRREDAAFQAAQRARAIKSYRDLIERYPASPQAAKARDRLRHLGEPPQQSPLQRQPVVGAEK